jgi:1,4-alpha-glucan branching enzyme
MRTPALRASVALALALAAPLLIGAAFPGAATAASNDNTVEWNGVSHYWWMDRRPLCPRAGESFQVRFQAWRNDLSAARVRVIDNAGTTWVDAFRIGTRGPYDLWAASLPATASPTESYLIELTDGTDTDYYGTAGMSDLLPAGQDFALDFTTLAHAPLGATPVQGGVVFKCWSPNRTQAWVRGTWNGFLNTDPMTRVGQYFVAEIPAAQVGMQYRYAFENGVNNADPRARAVSSSASPNGVIIDPFAYQWQSDDHTYQPVPQEQMIVYQMHVGTFAGRNDPAGAAPTPSRFIDVANRVNHLAELGITTVMACPFTAFPADLSAGYNPITMWAPETKYGSPEQLKYLVDRLHQNGVGMLLDAVWNHFSNTDNYLWNWDGDQNWFDNPPIATPWGSQADFDRAEVRDYFAHSAHLWLEEYRLDGFRMDGTDYMNIGAQEAAGWSLMQRFNNEIDNRSAQAVAIAEQLPNDSWVTRPTSLGGAGFDAQYQDAFNDNLRQEILDAAFGDPEMWKISNIVNGSGQYLSDRYAFNYLELHDECWPSSGGQRIVKTIDPTAPSDDQYARGRSTMGQGVVFAAPGVPAILQGTEWLEDTDFGVDTANKIDWSKKTTYANVFRYYQDLIRMRRNSPSLWASAGHQVFHVNEGGNVIAWQRWDLSGNVTVAVANFGNTNYPVYRIGMPQPGPWKEMINNQASTYGGSGTYVNSGSLATQATPYDGFAQSMEIKIPAMGFLLLQSGPAVTGVPDELRPSSGEVRFDAVTPNPAPGAARFAFTLARAGHVRVTVHDALGRTVATVQDGPLGAGAQQVSWDGATDRGARAPAGVYFARVTFEGSAVVRKFARIRG